jgi:hypothetical protein
LGIWETSADASLGRQDATAAPATLHAAPNAAGKSGFCHRNIVVLKTRRDAARRRSSGAEGADVTIQDALTALVRQVDSLLSARNLPARSLADHCVEPSDGPTIRPDVVRTGRGPPNDGPGEFLAQPISESTCADSVRIRNAP